MDVKQKIIDALQKASGVKDITLDVPEISEFGDYSSNVALQLIGKLQDTNNKTQTSSNLQLSSYHKPKELSEAIVDKLSKDVELSQYISRIEVAGSGFINFWLKQDYLLDVLTKTVSENFDIPKVGKGSKVVVEYSSPNIAKPFTVGHLRSTIIGDAIANLMEATGYQVYRDNHLGDWGTQFGKQIYAIKTWGDMEVIENSDNPVRELVDLYVKFHKEAENDKSIEDEARKWFKRLEDGDNEARELWQKCVDLSWNTFERIYETLGVKFSPEFDNGRGLGESYFEDKMKVVIDELQEKDFLKEGEKGAKLVFFPDEKYPPAMILKGDGATLYHTRDLAADRYRLDTFGRQLIIINEVGMEQSLYFKQLFEIERLLGWVEDGQRVHIPHGLVRFKDGKMSTRKGNVIWLEDVLEEAMTRAKKFKSASDDLAQIIAIGAIKWNDLKRDPKTEIVFDWDEILNMEGNSGPYLQYTYARAISVINKAVGNKQLAVGKLDKLSNEEKELLRAFVQYGGVVVRAANNHSPNLLCNYLYNLASKFNSFYNAQKIVGGENEEFRLALTSATANTLKHGLSILGIESPEKM